MSESPFSQAPIPRGARSVVAHRGASAEEAENTLPALERAIEAGADAVEIDVRLTADGHPVVLHDADLARTTDERGPVRERTLSEVKRLRVRTSSGDAAEVPTLLEALDACLGRIAVDVEIKNLPGEPDFDPTFHAVAEATVRALAAAGAAGRVLVSSFDPWSLERVRELEPELEVGLLVDAAVEADAALTFARERGFDWILPPVERLADDAASIAARAHEVGIAIGTWTTDDPAVAIAMLGAGVDAVATNDPATLVQAVRGAFAA